jgi:archaellum biogenesis ATPase FlaH
MLNIAKHIIFSLFSFLMLYSCANVNQEKKFLSNLENVIQQQTEDAVIINIDSLTEFYFFHK